MLTVKSCTPSLVLSILGLMGWANHSFAAAQPRVQLTTTPPMEQVVPGKQPVKLMFQVLDEQGKRVQKAKIHLQISTPSKTPWFTSDFPIVEGTQLLDLEAIASSGQLEVQQVLPIRGNYQLIVEVQPLDGKAFSATQQTLTVSVPEKPVKYINFGILAVVLLGVGLGGGWVLGEAQKTLPGEVAPERVRLLLSGAILVAIASLLVVNIQAELAESHHHEHHAHDDHTPAVESSSPVMQVKWLGDDQATVGKLAQIGVQLSDRTTGKPVTDAVLQVKAIQDEHHETVFVYQGVPDATGKLTWQQQFFDGAPHTVQVEVSPQVGATRQFSPFQVSQEIEVAAVAPPLHVRLITLAYMTSILGLGLGLGIKIRRSPQFSLFGKQPETQEL
jgi:hypothetical protein